MILLSILIPTLTSRTALCDALLSQLSLQIESFPGENEIETIEHEDNGEDSIGNKRNFLLGEAQGKYVAFIDDDDRISDFYIKHLLDGIRKDVDCCSMRGIIYEKNSPPRHFEHSLRYNKYETVSPDPDGFSDRKYLRFPNHLNCIRASIAKQFKFPEINHGEDTDWATQIHNLGLLKTEHYIDDVLYYYTPSDTRK